MNQGTIRLIFRWIHIVLAFLYSVIFIVRLTKFQTTPPLLGFRSCTYPLWSLDVERPCLSTNCFEEITQ
jgi:hypothetical protein